VIQLWPENTTGGFEPVESVQRLVKPDRETEEISSKDLLKFAPRCWIGAVAHLNERNGSTAMDPQNQIKIFRFMKYFAKIKTTFFVLAAPKRD